MENASKFLIIAAAVLIAIIIISVVIKIVSSTEETTDSTDAVGKTISQQTSDAKSEAEGYTVVRLSDKNVELKPTNKTTNFYQESQFNSGNNIIKLEKNVEYIISFDYYIKDNKLENGNEFGVYCAVGFISQNNTKRYIFLENIPYSRSKVKKGHFEYKFKTDSIYFNPEAKSAFENATYDKYLLVRFVRLLSDANDGFCKVNLSDITIKWKKQ